MLSVAFCIPFVSQKIITCSNSPTKTPEQGMKEGDQHQYGVFIANPQHLHTKQPHLTLIKKLGAKGELHSNYILLILP